MREDLALGREDFYYQPVGNGKPDIVESNAIDAFIIRNIRGNTDHLYRLRSNLVDFKSVISANAELEFEQQFVRIDSYVGGRSRRIKDEPSQRGCHTEAEALRKLFDGVTVGGDKRTMQAFRSMMRAFELRAFDQPHQRKVDARGFEDHNVISGWGTSAHVIDGSAWLRAGNGHKAQGRQDRKQPTQGAMRFHSWDFPASHVWRARAAA